MAGDKERMPSAQTQRPLPRVRPLLLLSELFGLIQADNPFERNACRLSFRFRSEGKHRLVGKLSIYKYASCFG